MSYNIQPKGGNKYDDSLSHSIKKASTDVTLETGLPHCNKLSTDDCIDLWRKGQAIGSLH